MNERIRELAKQAGGHFSTHNLMINPVQHRESIELWDKNIEKFAELIVKEYEKLLPETCPWADADKEGPMKGWHVQFVARKHFGVEE